MTSDQRFEAVIPLWKGTPWNDTDANMKIQAALFRVSGVETMS